QRQVSTDGLWTHARRSWNGRTQPIRDSSSRFSRREQGESMKRSTEQILTTHTGSLPRPPHVADLIRAAGRGEPVAGDEFESAIRQSVAGVVRQQRTCGLTVVNDGEHSKASFNGYRSDRLD